MTTYPSGISFPFRFSDAGGVQKADGGKKVMANMHALITTALNERLVRRQVGTVGYQQVLRTLVYTRTGSIEAIIRQAIARFEPRAVSVTVKVYQRDLRDGTHVFADISFIFKFTGDPVNETVQLD